MSDRFPAELVAAARTSAAWPFEEAKKLVARIEARGGEVREVLFETGYGPSGLPHIGTFGEVARTTMVRHAFDVLTDARYPSRLICFSDDMDGMRKVPDNVPQPEMLRAHLGKPLTKVPDPFGQYESFGHHNNAMLRRFLDACRTRGLLVGKGGLKANTIRISPPLTITREAADEAADILEEALAESDGGAGRSSVASVSLAEM